MTPSPLAHKLDAARALELSRGTRRKKVDRGRSETFPTLSHGATQRRSTFSPLVADMKRLFTLLWQSRLLVDLKDLMEMHFAWSWGVVFTTFAGILSSSVGSVKNMPEKISISDFVSLAKEDISSPGSSGFQSKMSDCRSTVATLEEVRVFTCVQVEEDNTWVNPCLSIYVKISWHRKHFTCTETKIF